MNVHVQYVHHVQYLLVVVEAVDHWGLCGGQLRQHVQQLEDHVLVVVDDGKMEGTGGGREKERVEEGEGGRGREREGEGGRKIRYYMYLYCTVYTCMRERDGLTCLPPGSARL